jgi:hypothetical protein
MDEIFNKSVIVVAHPDDEILWFSSILKKVDEVIISFLNIKSNSRLSMGRLQTLDSYPIRNVKCLHMDEAEVYNQACWNDPVITEYGIKINNNKGSENRYIKNYYNLYEKLENNLKDKYNVFTHNPWGEYGNEEHIQVYRVIKDLQGKYKYNIWFDNYCSNKSYKIMMEYICNNEFTYYSTTTNKELASNIKNIYLKNGCWTWSDNFQWFDDESFISDVDSGNKRERFDKIFPINLIKDRFYIDQLNKQKCMGWFGNLKSSLK